MSAQTEWTSIGLNRKNLSEKCLYEEVTIMFDSSTLTFKHFIDPRMKSKQPTSAVNTENTTMRNGMGKIDPKD